MANANNDNGPKTPTTFREAYRVLQKHAEALRGQQEPNIDELVGIVTESVEAYRVCKERIDAVEQALQRTLGEAENDEAPSAGDGRGSASSPSSSRSAASGSPDTDDERRQPQPAPRAASPAQPKRSVDDFDEDIPF